jgi:[ribosomal protein S5]-alanine N-acetyltransferase
MFAIETKRLTFRHLEERDGDFILALLNSSGFLENIGDKGVRDLAQARDYIANGPRASYLKHGFGLYLVSLSDTAEPVGICGLIKRPALDEVDIGYAFMGEFSGQGFASEATRAVMAHGQALDIGPIVAIVSSHNLASKAVLAKLGLSFSRYLFLPGETVPVEVFT